MRTRNILIGTLLVFSISLGSFWLGLREGAKLGLLIDATPKGSISLYQLEELKQGSTKNTLIGLESDIDMALLYAARYENHPLYLFLEPVWNLPISSSKRSLTRLANYRKFHFSPIRAEALASESPPSDPIRREAFNETINGAKENDLIILGVVQKYATTP